MSRDTKIKDTKRIITGFDYETESQLFYDVGTEGCIPLSRDKIKYYADEACVEACQILYDLNIQTIYSGANVNGEENTNGIANIGISYDSMSDENKSIAASLKENGIVGIDNNFGRGQGYTVNINIPINSDDLVGDVSDKLKLIASQFVQQDVLYGKTNEKEIRERYNKMENGNYFDYITFGELTPQEFEERITEEVSNYYPDDEGNLYVTEDLLNKHLAYKMNNTKTR